MMKLRVSQRLSGCGFHCCTGWSALVGLLVLGFVAWSVDRSQHGESHCG